MAKKKNAKQIEFQVVILKNGEEYRVVREDGKYLYCDRIVLRHGSPQIDRIETKTVTTEEREPEEHEEEQTGDSELKGDE